MQKNVILDVKDLHTEFDTKNGVVHAVNGISYVLHEGETLGIVGESGCGKSVSVLALLKLLPIPPARISGGGVLFQDRDLLELPTEDLQHIRGSKIAMVFQDPMTSLNPVHTIGFQIMEPLRQHMHMGKEAARDRAIDLLKMVGIADPHRRLGDYPHQFSGGMRQRVMIAMCLACSPDLVIADEPTTALDVTIQAQIVDLVKRLRDQSGMSLIWITHDLGIVAGLADRVLVMYAGLIVEETTVDELYTHPSHPYTAALLHSIPHMDGKRGEALESIKGFPPDLVRLPAGCPFAARCGYVKEKCTVNPSLTEIAHSHRIACWVDIKTGELL